MRSLINTVHAFVQKLRHDDCREIDFAVKASNLELEQRLKALEIKVGQKADQQSVDGVREQLESERAKNRTWASWDGGISLVLVAVAFLLLLLIGFRAPFILQNAAMLVRVLVIISGIISIASALASVFLDRMKRTLGTVAVMLACLSLGSTIYNPDSPAFHDYWDGQETVACTADLKKLPREKIESSLYKLLGSTPSSERVFLCSPVRTGN